MPVFPNQIDEPHIDIGARIQNKVLSVECFVKNELCIVPNFGWNFCEAYKTKTKVELNNLSGRFHQRELEFTNQAGLQSGCMGAVISGTSL